MPVLSDHPTDLCNFLLAADRIAQMQTEVPAEYVQARHRLLEAIITMFPADALPSWMVPSPREKEQEPAPVQRGLLHQLLAGTLDPTDTTVTYSKNNNIMRVERGDQVCLIAEPHKGVPVHTAPTGDCRLAVAVTRMLQDQSGRHLLAHRLCRTLQDEAKKDSSLNPLLTHYELPFRPSAASMPPGANASPATKIRSASYEMLSNISTHVALGLAIEFRKGAAHVPSPFDLVVFLSSPDKPYFQRVQSPLWPRKKSGKAVLALLFPPGEDGFHISASESTTAPPLPTTTTSVDAAVEALFGQPSASASAATSAPLPSFPSNLHVLAGLATSPQHSTQAFQDLLNFVPELPGAHSWT